jgi:hypothetical protein
MGGRAPVGFAGGAGGKATRGIDGRSADPGAPLQAHESRARRTPEPPKLPEPGFAPASRPGPGAGDEPTEVERPVVDVRRPWTVYAAGAAALAAALIVVAILIARRGSVAASSSPLFEPEATSAARPVEPTPTPAPAARSTEPTARPAPPPVDPPTEVAATAKPSDAVTAHTDAARSHGAAPSPASEPSAPAADSTARPPRRHPPPQRPPALARPAAEKINAEELYREGLQAWIHGDGKTGLVLCKRVIQASPSFAPPWRVLGLIYEKSGDRASARNAFEKYLQLAPGAPDAPGIRERLDGL